MSKTDRTDTAMDPTPLWEMDFFSDLDFYLAVTLAKIADERDQLVVFSCALLSRMLSQGHVCMDINKMGGSRLDMPENEDQSLQLPDSGRWLERLASSRLVSPVPETPLVLDESGCLHLAKYYDFQQRLVGNILNRVARPKGASSPLNTADLLQKWTPEAVLRVDTQKEAVASAVQNRLTLISGGPGTGKTYVARAIKIVLEQFLRLHLQADPVILTLAPTGKAASKMDQGRTIHSVLKPYADRPGFRFNRDNLLKADAVIIDEASMIDLLLLTRLLEAIPPQAHVILMGDRHQLASVQAGSVFSDICGSGVLGEYTHELTHNFRSGQTGHIHQLANAVRDNRFSEVQTVLSQTDLPDVRFYALPPDTSAETLLSDHVFTGYERLLSEPDPVMALAHIDAFKILCAHNSGEYGTLQINHVVENILRRQGNSAIQKGQFKKVVMVNTNDYDQNLFNGDTGIVSAAGEKRMFFLKETNGGTRVLNFAQLPGHETAFATTVHKAQGSEFSRVLMLIPEKISPVLTRRLLYTGVTRAKEQLIIIGRMDTIKKAMQQDTKRYSAIDRLLNSRSRRSR